MGAKRLFENRMTIDQLVEYLDGYATKATVYKWVSAEGMPKLKIGKRLSFDADEVRDWLTRKGKINGSLQKAR